MRKRGVDGFRVLQSEEKEKYQTIMLQITLDMYQTLAAAVVVLYPGSGHRRRAVRHFYLRMLWNGHCRVRL